ncbi:MAG TPA: transcription antitermination factor NusB [Candidatus Caenarcaniphilales bacterium]
MQARRIARELALLGISQLTTNPEHLQSQELQRIILAAVRTLAGEVQDTLETAAAELQRSRDRLLSSDTRALDIKSSRAMVNEAIELAETATNRLGTAVDLPELIQLANQQEVRDYALQILCSLHDNRAQIDQQLSQALVEWQLTRLAHVDRDILRIAVTEILYLEVPDRVAINEAVELAKRYSGDEGHRFINGVLRRVTEQIKLTRR